MEPTQDDMFSKVLILMISQNFC